MTCRPNVSLYPGARLVASADETMLLPLADAVLANNGVTPVLARSDDGYTSSADLARLGGLVFRDVSFSRAKGRKLLGEETYAATVLAEAPRQRSAVEPPMFYFRHVHGFGRLRRRGVAVTRMPCVPSGRRRARHAGCAGRAARRFRVLLVGRRRMPYVQIATPLDSCSGDTGHLPERSDALTIAHVKVSQHG